MNYTILNARYTDHTHKQIYLTLKNEAGEEIPYFFCPNTNDTWPVYLYLQELYDRGEINPDFDEDADADSLAASKRSERDALLDETDKYMTTDYPITEETKEALREYRQALRDITEQEGFPNNIIWPTMPEIVKLKKTKS